jgi:hypothetical protein
MYFVLCKKCERLPCAIGSLIIDSSTPISNSLTYELNKDGFQVIPSLGKYRVVKGGFLIF